MHLESEESMSGDVSAKHLKTIWTAIGANQKDVNVDQWVEEVQAKLQKTRHVKRWATTKRRKCWGGRGSRLVRKRRRWGNGWQRRN